MRTTQVLKIPGGGRLLVDLGHVVAIERQPDDCGLVLFTRGSHVFKVTMESADAAMQVIERWTAGEEP